MDVSVAGTHALVRKRARSKAESNVRFFSLPPSCVLVHGVILVNGRIKNQTTAGNENNTRHSSSNQNRPMLAARTTFSIPLSFCRLSFSFPLYTCIYIYDSLFWLIVFYLAEDRPVSLVVVVHSRFSPLARCIAGKLV